MTKKEYESAVINKEPIAEGGAAKYFVNTDKHP
jgi:hypothetical protein